MAVQTKSFTTLVSDWVATVQGRASVLIDLTIGSILLSIGEAAAGVALWLQGVALQIAALTRFASSAGADADSWGADFNYPRLGAKAATGPVTFARFTPTAQATIPVGSPVQTQDGTQKYLVVADTNQSAYDAGLNAYVIAVNVASCTATVESTVATAAANVGAGVINTLGSAIPGVDTVTNAAPFENGADPESDPNYKARFPEYIASLSKATKAAIENAIESVQQGVSFTLTENLTYAGATDDGYFYAVVDDGSGAPSSDFLDTVFAAIDAVRGFTIRFGVFAPVVVNANVAMTVTVGAGYTHTAVAALVQAALQSYIDSLALGATLQYTILAQVARGASPGVSNVTGVTLNSGTSDLTATNQQVIKAGTITVS